MGNGGRKFFFPLIMKEPVVKYSPDGAVLLTCELSTHQAVVITLASHAALEKCNKKHGIQ
jgi:hypothetical protein